MVKHVNLLVAAAVAVGALSMTATNASAMPAAPKDAVAQSGEAAGLEQAHAVWVCRYGRCFWTHGGHHHGGHGWGGHGHWGGHHGWGWGGHHGGHWGHHGHHGHHHHGHHHGGHRR
ncbi:hypothetical protein LG047_14540 [Methylocystis sp. WRRC1]|uniref:hypothetical protein n=1 Tax=Methylocystis sp. WRRC1 TaxID=1732014 RepID=UPI001D13C938|nr:hypothetical protein [Methylocystis sp. WRRC1]MCC3246518.1 hypothetical protein [Methylocystis sp. WRRC1]